MKTLLAKTKSMLRKTIDLLLPALFPSWRFFKEVGPSPRVEYRVVLKGQRTAWRESHPVPERVGLGSVIARMVWNPARNTQLYMVSLSERLVSGRVEHSASELNHLIAAKIEESQGDLQFRLMFMDDEGGAITGTVVYESEPVPLSEVRR